MSRQDVPRPTAKYPSEPIASAVRLIHSPSKWRSLALLLLVGVLTVAGCTATDDEDPLIVQPGAPGEPGRVLDGMPEVEPPPHTEADVQFVQNMIAHHEQALRMVRLVPDRATGEGLPLFARRIELSQDDEIAVMQRWLQERGAGGAGGHHHGNGDMPGMLTEDQFAELAAATGADFDRLFLELMIYHHEGAITMVGDLFAAGGGQEPELYQLVAHIDSDQRIEINRMRRMLAEMADG